MGRMMTVGAMLATLAAGVALPAWQALAEMGAADIMERLHPREKGKLTLDEVRDAAAATYDRIAKAYGGKVSMLQVGGRVTQADLKAANIGDGETDEPISKADYMALASRFFAEANITRPRNVSPADGTLDIGELSTPAGRKLLRLLE